jgi:diguanylate cyclase (GGDEF)-like protein/PAS domain S-box-containing protein
MGDGLYFTDLEGRITYWNNAAERLSGYSRSEVLGKLCRDNLLMHVDSSGCLLCTSKCPIRATIDDGQPREADLYLHHKNGSRVPIRVRATPLRNAAGKIIGAVELFSDNSAKAEMQERLTRMEQLALLDSLTNLPNRRYMESHIHSRVEEFKRDGWPFGILFIDIDDFKQVNDRLGHPAGDRVLKMVAATLNANSRYFDVVGRWGGEEFVAVMHHVDDQELYEIADRMRVLVGESVLTDLDSLRVTVSIGTARIMSGEDEEDILRRADKNLYRAKQSGKNCVCGGIQPAATRAFRPCEANARLLAGETGGAVIRTATDK